MEIRATEQPRRVINYLRISVTDLCNYRCTYCMPPEGVEQLSHKEILSFEEICAVVRAAIPMGINRVRLTGGEPLVRKGTPDLIRMLANLPGIGEVYLTTNGSMLEEFSEELRRNGLNRLNVSMDSMKSERYTTMTRGGDLDKVWRGIEAARKAGFDPIKINVVVIKGVNDDEIADFVDLTRQNPFEVRFIEYMPFGPTEELRNYECVTAEEVKKRIATLGRLHPLPRHRQNGPAQRYQLEGAKGTLGFIPAMSHSFCSTCNRIRLTADGRLLSCLFSGRSIDVRSLLRSNAPREDVSAAIQLAIDSKPAVRSDKSESFMSSIGG
jgi:cyclic pyranopterin phosphate synthase